MNNTSFFKRLLAVVMLLLPLMAMAQLDANSCDTYYVEKTDGGIDAFPDSTISSINEVNSKLTVVAKDGTTFIYSAAEYRSVSTTCAIEFGHITSFKFNNKFNPDIIQDAEGVILNDSLIQLTVAGIGKWLTPSFKIEGDAQAKVYVNGQEQTSKVSRNSFRNEVTYTLSRPNFRILHANKDGGCAMQPFGKDYVVCVDFLTDSGRVPTIYLTTDDGEPVITKTTYKTGTIRIDGGDVFANLDEMPMQIKGRGNTSWTDNNPTAKNPYHIKFGEKTNVLGLGKGKHWNLIANKNPMSMMTEVISMKVARMVGTQAANDEIPVELYVNGDYRGSYNLTQKIGFGNNSLDVKDTLENACLLELDKYFDEINKFKTPSTLYALPVNVKKPDTFSDGSSQLTLNDIQNRFNAFLQDLKDSVGVDKHVNVNSLATFLLVNELALNYELWHPKSVYCFCRDILQPDSLFHFGPVWDFDWAYGYGGNSGNVHFFQVAETDDYWSSISTFFQDLRYNSGSAFEREYFRVWTDFMQNHLTELLDFCEEYQTYAQPSFDNDANRWKRMADYATQVQEAKTWLTKRANYVYDHLANELGYADKYEDVVSNPTPIEQITLDREPALQKVDNAVYTLDGRKMNTNTRLPHGVYIINKRKIVIQ